MTIQQAIEALKPLGKKLGSSICIDMPSIWIWDHDNQKAEVEQWRIYTAIDTKAYYGATLEQTVKVAIAAHEEGSTIEQADKSLVGIEALATAS